MKNYDKGKKGEHIALDFLYKKKFQLLHQNYRYQKKEIDLIMQDANTLVFVEVKMRTSSEFGFPEHFVDAKKEAFLRQAAEYFLEEQAWKGAIRFDIIAILGEGEKYEIEHFEDVF